MDILTIFRRVKFPANILLVIGAIDELRVQVAMAVLVSDVDGAMLLLLHHRLILAVGMFLPLALVSVSTVREINGRFPMSFILFDPGQRTFGTIKLP